MPETHAQSLRETAASIFEQLAFFFPEAADGPVQPTCGDGIVGVDFAGTFDGRLLVRFSDGALLEFTANMLGTAEPPDAASQKDALGELANVICGNVVPRIGGDCTLFELSAPQHYPSWEAAYDGAGTRTGHAALRIDSGRADVILCVR
jgi:CheY-specific phosphatase CheX